VISPLLANIYLHWFGYRPVLSVKVPEWLGRALAWLECQVAFSGLPFFALFHQYGGH
jgi:hypothetical protein